MTNNTHTNGPWHICNVTGGQIDPLIRDENGFCVAQAVKPSNSRAAYIDEQANARLIAAAPELLQVCERVAGWLYCTLLKNEGEGIENAGKAYWEMLAAIQKARGLA